MVLKSEVEKDMVENVSPRHELPPALRSSLSDSSLAALLSAPYPHNSSYDGSDQNTPLARPSAFL